MSNWVCYILKSIDSNKTYVGATDNLYRRLNDHNGINGKSKGAKATKGRIWMPILFISGFPNKIACLSFESGVRHVRKRKGCLYYNSGNPVEKRVKSVYNLLHLQSPLKKWFAKDLTVNWLELNYYNVNLKLPLKVIEKKGINEINNILL